MKVNWSKLIFVIFMMSAWLTVMVIFIKAGSESKEKRELELRQKYSPMSDSKEIQEAYNSIRK